MPTITWLRRTPSLLLLLLSMAALAACGRSADEHAAGGGGSGAKAAKRTRTLTLGAYTTPREAYGKAVLPAFRKLWKERTGEDVRFQESYLGSGAQARAIVAGFEADVAALSLEADIEKIAKAGLIKHAWKQKAREGMISTSIVVFAVRAGNPKAVRDWDDLTRAGTKVLTPNVRTSGGAMWNIAALWGASLRGHTRAKRDDPAGAQELLQGVLRNVTVMDKGARESMITFERGEADVAITYENEVIVGRRAGKTYEYVVPASTISIENPVAVVDRYADEHGNRDIAEAFVEFLVSPAAQRSFAEYGLRPVDPEIGREVAARLPRVTDLFTIRDLGGWPAAQRTLFDPGGAYDRASAAAAAAP